MAVDPSADQFKKISGQLASVRLDSEAAIAIVSFGVGALFGLRQACRLGYRDRTSTVAAGNLATEVRAVAAELGVSDSTTHREWLAGLYFNLALERIDAADHLSLDFQRRLDARLTRRGTRRLAL